MIRSLRFTLTLWYVGILALTLCGFSGAMYSSVSANLDDDLDRSLSLEASGVSDAIFSFWKAEKAALGSSVGNWAVMAPQTLKEVIQQGWFSDLITRWANKTQQLKQDSMIRLLDADGKVILSSGSFSESFSMPSEGAIEKMGIRRPLFSTIVQKDIRLRLLTQPVIEKNEPVYFIQIAASMAHNDETLDELRERLLWLVPLTLLITSLIGWFLAKLALRPIDSMITHAQRIGVENLSERVKVPHTGDELEKLAVTFNRMLDRLDQSFRRMRQFSAAASHELRTPLTVMRGELEVALRKPRSDEEYKRVLNTNLEIINDMTRTIEELLTLARSEAAGEAIEWQPLEIGLLVSLVIEFVQKLAGSKKVNLTFENKDDVWIRGENRLLTSLFANLLDNAIRHTPFGGSVIVKIQKDKHEASIVVSDTGPGIAPEVLPQVFERFFRARSADSSEGSAGLGLGLCRWIAEAHHGSIEASSPPGAGAVFTVRLPLLSHP